MKFLADKKIGFYLSIVAVVLALAALIPYGQASYATANVKWLIAAAAVLEILLCVLSLVKKSELANTCEILVAVCLSAALILSLVPQVTSIAYVFSGLYNFDQIRSYVVFAAMTAVSWLLCIVASFAGVVKTGN